MNDFCYRVLIIKINNNKLILGIKLNNKYIYRKGIILVLLFIVNKFLNY